MTERDGIQLYALDGGRIVASGTDAAEMSDDGAYAGRTLEMSVPCFLIRHPHGDLMWDTGMSPRRTDLGDWATPGASLADQLQVLDLAPADVSLLSVSHGHWDHSGNAGLFAASTWIVNPDERAYMFDDANRGTPSMDDYGALEAADTRLITDDHDVFGDGSVVIVQAPGHSRATPCCWFDWPRPGRSSCPAASGTWRRAANTGGCRRTTRIAPRRLPRWTALRPWWQQPVPASSSSTS